MSDYFDMHNTASESDADQDLGSGGALVLPDLKDAAGNTWQLAVGAGKDRRIYVVNRNGMGKFNTQKDNAIYQVINHALAGGVYSMPAYFQNTVYFGPYGDALKAFSSRTPSSFPHPRQKPPPSSHIPELLPAFRRMVIRTGSCGRWQRMATTRRSPARLRRARLIERTVQQQPGRHPRRVCRQGRHHADDRQWKSIHRDAHRSDGFWLFPPTPADGSAAAGRHR